MRNVIGVGAAGVAVAFLSAGCAEDPRGLAAAPTGAAAASTGPNGSYPEPEITAQEAQVTALEAVDGGWILETKIEERDDDADESDWDVDDIGEDEDFEAAVDVWEVTVVSPEGRRHQVSVAMTDGSVLDNRVDD